VSGLINTVKVEKGTTFTYQVSIRNDGPIPVTIKDIGMRGGAITTRVVAVNSHPYENGGSSRGFMPFSAFRLDPDQEAIIEMAVQVGADACVGGRDSLHGSRSRSRTRSSASRAIPLSKRARRSASKGPTEPRRGVNGGRKR
jgi:hypothetical protein